MSNNQTCGAGDASSVDDEIELLKQKFLCRHPFADISFTNLFTWCVGEEDASPIQRKFLAATLKHPVAEKYPLPRAYRRDFLKGAISELENLRVEVIQEIYDLYLTLCSYDPEEDFAYKSYKLQVDGGCDWVHIKEARSIAADGTTGVHSWPAGVALANWCLQNRAELAGKVVLELGSGVGLTGLTIIKACRTKSYVFTDYHPQVFTKIRENLMLNNLVSLLEKNDSDSEATSDEAPSSPIHVVGDIAVMRLDWRYANSVPKNLDFVIGSDLIFDPDLIQPLVETVGRLIEANADSCRVLIAITQRNPETVQRFESEIDAHHAPCLTRTVIEFDDHVPLLWAAKHENVKLYAISKQ